jgi:hypothetical protein
MAQTPYALLKSSQFKAMLTSTLGSLKPYQIRQILEWMSRHNVVFAPMSDVSVEQNFTAITANY